MGCAICGGRGWIKVDGQEWPLECRYSTAARVFPKLVELAAHAWRNG